MDYIKITDFCKKTGHAREDVEKLIEDWSVGKVKIGNAWAIGSYIANKIDNELSMPEEIQLKIYKARFLHGANNSNYVFAKVEDHPNKHPVLIPRKFKGKLKNKFFEVEKIEDNSGFSFRHIDFSRLQSNASQEFI